MNKIIIITRSSEYNDVSKFKKAITEMANCPYNTKIALMEYVLKLLAECKWNAVKKINFGV